MSSCDDNRPHGGVPATPATYCGHKKTQKRTPLGEVIDREKSAYAVVEDDYDDYGIC